MPKDSDGSVVISVTLATDDLNRECERLKKKILRLEEDLTVGRHKKDALTENLKSAQKELEDLQSKTIISGGKAIISQENVSRISELKEEISNTEAEIDRQNKSIEETQMLLDGVKFRYGEVAQMAEQAASPEPAGDSERQVQEVQRAASQMGTVTSRLKSTVTEGVNLIRLGLSAVAHGFTDMAAKGVSAVGKLSNSLAVLIKNGLKKLISYTGKAAASFLSLSKTSKKANGGFSSALKMILKYGLGVRSFYFLFRKIRTAIAEGFKNLAQYSDETNKSISMVTSALTQLKNSTATALSPILSVVAPILTDFINLLSKAAANIGMLFAAISGKKTFAKAVAVQEDYAESLKNTSDAAKDASKSLASFDEINKLSGESSAGSETSISDMFETVEIEPISFESWGQAFSSMLDSILNKGIQKIKNGLTAFADWLNSFSGNLYEMFTFPGVYEKVSLVGVDLANALNGLVNQIDWGTFGGSLGAGINTALGLLVSFVYAFDWMNLGASIAEMVNKAISEIDWNNVGEWLWDKFKIAIETLAGFLLNLDMTQLAQSASNIVIGFFDSMTETIKNIDWFALGEQVKEFLVNVDWGGIATSVCTAIGTGFAAALNVLFGAIKDYFAPYIEWANENGLTIADAIIVGLFEGIAKAISGIYAFIRDNIFKPLIEAFCNVFGIHSPSTVMAEMGGYLMAGLLNGITSKIASVVATFTALKEKIQDVFAHISDWFRDKFSAAWQAVKDVFSSGGGGEVFDGIKDGILSGLKAVINALISGINKVISIPFNGINTALRSIKNVDILGLKPFYWINTISIPQIPKLASGAVIPPNREFMAVLGDQKHGTNIEAPLSTIQEAVALVMNDMAGGVMAGFEALLEENRRLRAVVEGIEVGDSTIGQAAARYNNRMAIIKGGL